MAVIFQRPELAAQLAERLLQPGVLDEGLRSGLFLSGDCRTGKSTFLLKDLLPALENAGAIVIYVDLWSDVQTSPAVLVHAAVRRTLESARDPASVLPGRLGRLAVISAGALGFSFGFDVSAVGTPDGPTLARVFTDLVDQARTDVVLIVDEVQHAVTNDSGRNLMLALKAARDAVNARAETPGHLLFIGTGSHRALVRELTARRSEAFAGATSIDYPVLDEHYVTWLLDRLSDEGVTTLPSPGVANAAFETLGHRPEELLKAMTLLASGLASGSSPDDNLPIIALTLRTAAADVEFEKLERLGGLARAVFDRIASADGDARGVFSEEAAAEYSVAAGRPVRIETVQPVVHELLAANLVMRLGHGRYGVSDPFVRQTWLARQGSVVLNP